VLEEYSCDSASETPEARKSGSSLEEDDASSRKLKPKFGQRAVRRFTHFRLRCGGDGPRANAELILIDSSSALARVGGKRERD